MCYTTQAKNICEGKHICITYLTLLHHQYKIPDILPYILSSVPLELWIFS